MKSSKKEILRVPLSQQFFILIIKKDDLFCQMKLLNVIQNISSGLVISGEKWISTHSENKLREPQDGNYTAIQTFCFLDYTGPISLLKKHIITIYYAGCPGGTVVKNLAVNAREQQEKWVWFRVRKIPWRRNWQPTPVFLPGKSHGQRSLVGFSPCMYAKLVQLCLTLCDLTDCSLPGSSVHGDSLGKNTGVGCHALLQGIFPTQGSNLCLLVCCFGRQVLYH